MDMKLNLVEILKNVPKGTELYSTVHGEVIFDHIEKDHSHPIKVTNKLNGVEFSFTEEGLRNAMYNGECILFPSKDNRDWSTFKVNKSYKVGDYLRNKDTNNVFKITKVDDDLCSLIGIVSDKSIHSMPFLTTEVLDRSFEHCDKFPLDSLRPFDRVLVRNDDSMWACALFSHAVSNTQIKAACQYWNRCVPYNDETKHLVGTMDDAPEFYK